MYIKKEEANRRVQSDSPSKGGRGRRTGARQAGHERERLGEADGDGVPESEAGFAAVDVNLRGEKQDRSRQQQPDPRQKRAVRSERFVDRILEAESDDRRGDRSDPQFQNEEETLARRFALRGAEQVGKEIGDETHEVFGEDGKESHERTGVDNDLEQQVFADVDIEENGEQLDMSARRHGKHFR
ncbi:MAG: hypothetical protein M0C28_18985 [Candidatus Moduliflexus flocculans]|nr:hypothetical protein [Candidatus Moduliflexus flocculans]